MLQTKADLKFSASLSQYFCCLTVYFSLWKNLIKCDVHSIIASFCKQTLVFCIARTFFIKKYAFKKCFYFQMN